MSSKAVLSIFFLCIVVDRSQDAINIMVGKGKENCLLPSIFGVAKTNTICY